MTIRQTTPESSITVSTAGYINKGLIGGAGLPDVFLGLIIKVPDDSGEDIVGIRITRYQLLDLRREIDLYLQKVSASPLEDIQTGKNKFSVVYPSFAFKLRPGLVVDIREKDSLFEAKTRLEDSDKGCCLYASGKGSSKEAAIFDLNQNIECLINAINAKSDPSES